MGDPDAMAEQKEGKIEGSEANLTLHLLNPSLLEKEKLTFLQMDGKAWVDSVVKSFK